MEKIGLIAGSGQFPTIFSKVLLLKHFSIYTVAYFGEANSELSENSTKLEWMHPGQINRLIKFFKKNNVKHAVMVGAIKKTNLLKDIKPDIKAIAIIAQLETTHDDVVMCAFAKSLERAGISILSPTSFMPELIATRGIWTKRNPSRSERKDIEIGIRIAKEIGKMDIGQSVVIGQGSVLAVEAVDGTDATIKRGGSLCSRKAVLVKICKPNQDKRFDIPAIGLKTIENMHKHNISVLAVKSKETVVFDKSEMIEKANKHGIAITCF